jgi:hypothetical protein
MYTSKTNYQSAYAVSVSLGVRRLKRRIDFFFWIRRNSLFETNHRFRRTVLKMPLLATFLRKRFSNWSCDSFGRKVTDVNLLTSFRPAWITNPAIWDKKTRLTFAIIVKPGEGPNFDR